MAIKSEFYTYTSLRYINPNYLTKFRVYIIIRVYIIFRVYIYMYINYNSILLYLFMLCENEPFNNIP